MLSFLFSNVTVSPWGLVRILSLHVFVYFSFIHPSCPFIPLSLVYSSLCFVYSLILTLCFIYSVCLRFSLLPLPIKVGIVWINVILSLCPRQSLSCTFCFLHFGVSILSMRQCCFSFKFFICLPLVSLSQSLVSAQVYILFTLKNFFSNNFLLKPFLFISVECPLDFFSLKFRRWQFFEKLLTQQQSGNIHYRFFAITFFAKSAPTLQMRAVRKRLNCLTYGQCLKIINMLFGCRDLHKNAKAINAIFQAKIYWKYVNYPQNGL